MDTIYIKPLFHRGKEIIAIEAPYNAVLTLAIRKLKGVKWSQSHKVWYLPWGKDSYDQLVGALKPLATLDVRVLRAYLDKRNEVKTAKTIPPDKGCDERNGNALCRQLPLQSPVWNLSQENGQAPQRYVQQLKLKAYSTSTMQTYRNEFLQLLRLLKRKPVYDLTTDDLRRYFVYCHEKLKLKENSLHSRINAVKFYFEQVPGREKFFWEIPRPKKPLQLPKLLNEDELGRLFNALTNKKHKAMLFTAYSAGLRVSEVVNLKIAHVDSQRMQLFIERTKGKKDRYVNLSPILLDILRAYLKQSKPRPKVYLFESEYTSGAFPTRTVQQIFSNAKHKAGIRKDVGIHSLRHSFATHLLNKGTDIRYIKDLLGHFDIRTTERYLHVSRKALVNITSPVDDLWKKGSLEW